MTKIYEWLAKTRDSLKTWSGWLDLLASAFGGLLTLDPAAALIARDILPEPLQPFYTLLVVVVLFILPKMVRKKDAEAADENAN